MGHISIPLNIGGLYDRGTVVGCTITCSETKRETGQLFTGPNAVKSGVYEMAKSQVIRVEYHFTAFIYSDTTLERSENSSDGIVCS